MWVFSDLLDKSNDQVCTPSCSSHDRVSYGRFTSSPRLKSSTQRRERNFHPSSVLTNRSWSSPTLHGSVVAASCPETIKTISTVVPSAALAPSATKRMFPHT